MILRGAFRLFELISLNQLATVTGIFLVNFTNLGITAMGDDTWDVEMAWRYMFGTGVILGLVFLILLFFVPESPRG